MFISLNFLHMGFETVDHQDNLKDTPDKKDGPDKGMLVFAQDPEVKSDPKNEGITLFPVSKSSNPEEEATERKQNLELLDQKLQIESLRTIIDSPKKSSYKVETDVSGEQYTFDMVGFYHGKDVIKDNKKMMRDLDSGKININELSVEFSCVDIKGRPEVLNLKYKTTVAEVISGATNLSKRTRETFAGTDDHYKKLSQNQEKQELTIEQKEQRAAEAHRITDILKEQKHEVSELTYEGGPIILHAFIPGQSKQLIISSINGALWNISEKSATSEREKSLITPNELINTLNSEEPW